MKYNNIGVKVYDKELTLEIIIPSRAMRIIINYNAISFHILQFLIKIIYFLNEINIPQTKSNLKMVTTSRQNISRWF